MSKSKNRTRANDLGALLRQWRDARNKSQMEASLDAGVSQRHLSFIEIGRSVPSRETLIGIAEALHQVSADMIPAASAALIGMSFLGALAGPALFSTARALSGSFRPAFLLLGLLSGVPALLLLYGSRLRASPS